MTSKTLKAQAQERKVFGRKVKTLRNQGILPCNIYGLKMASIALQMDTKEFLNIYEKAGETGLVELTVGKKEYPVLINDVQRDPILGTPLHADFVQVDLKAKITADVPVELVGEAPVEKLGGLVVQLIEEIEVEALPADLPERIEIDVTGLQKFEDNISVKDIKAGAKYEILTDPEIMVVKAEEPREEEPEPTVGEATGEEENTSEGEKPAESKGKTEQSSEEAPKEE